MLQRRWEGVSENRPNSARTHRRRAGTATVECALLAALVIFPLMMGTFEMTRAMMVRTILSDAARRGCRAGVKAGADNSSITSQVNGILTDNKITASDATTTIQVNGSTVNASTAKQDDKISVQVSIPFSKVAWIFGWFLKGTNVESEIVYMRRQG